MCSTSIRVAQFADDEDEMQQIRGLGTDIAVVGVLLMTFSLCNSVNGFSLNRCNLCTVRQEQFKSSHWYGSPSSVA